ncbi:MAG TPA: glycoside hydrolase family 19 protein [Reyranella sp.]|nr:glycoside hydrolase family 19 protein [Reyranella sp.]
MIDRNKFFAAARVNPFGGFMTVGQVEGCTALLDEWEARVASGQMAGDVRWLAYMLATAKWETAHTMQPVEEYGRGAGRPYGRPDPDTGQTYYGRGYVQLTWKSNYQRMALITGADLVKRPELALDPKVAAQILFEGMGRGMFTGVGLPRYFGDGVDDPVNARRIINGTDHADDIAAIHAAFLAALTGA